MQVHFTLCIGDNILTAINIAKKCGMCGQDDAIVRINVEDTDDGDQAPTLNYKQLDTSNQNMKSAEDLEVCKIDI